MINEENPGFHKKTLVLVVLSFQNNIALPIRPGVGEDTG